MRGRRLGPVFGLLLLAPFTGELLLGNVTAGELGLDVVLTLVALYGCGALLVRELGRRTGGWPSMLLLAAAYALIEEGPVDQLLFSHNYQGYDYLSGPTYLPALGMSVELTQTVLALHTVWSICVPIAIVETLASGRRDTPWLGRAGLGVTATVFALLVILASVAVDPFVASPAQLGGVGVVIVAVVVLACTARWRRLPSVGGAAPSPWVCGAAALAGTSIWWAPLVLAAPHWYAWIGVAVWCAVVAAGVWLLSRWSRQDGWDQRHRLALAAGAAVTYIWTSFPLRPESGGSLALDLATNLACAAIALAILALAARATTRPVPSLERPAHAGTAPTGPAGEAHSQQPAARDS